ncbi:MAG TPA: hypothetical protein VHW23_14920 [Kofleriaceae bacterium]|jgi:hypothetical protein|nr:hypothetical protein [Kofleriaceae bacterium]
MAQKFDWSAWRLGLFTERAVINRNAEELDYVQGTLSSLWGTVQRQQQEILQLRATLIGVIEVLHARAPFDVDELDRAVQTALTDLTAPPPPPPSPPPASTDPYRGLPAEPTPPPVRLVLCLQCGRQVPASQTTITENGEVCDACA